MRLNCARLCAVFVISPSILSAQLYTGTISGTIRDTSGGLVPRASVTITNQQTDRQESVTADLAGRYTSLPLPPGVYRVEAGLQGFRRATRTNITVQIATTVVVDFTLELGDLTDEIEVRATAPVLETSSGTIGKVVDNGGFSSCRSTRGTCTR